MPKKFTYANAGVNRDLRIKSKRALDVLKETYKFSLSGGVIQLPYGNVFPFQEDLYLDLVIEGVGTKVLVAQLAEKYDTIGIDGVAMAVNDVIRSGAKPLAIVDNIHAQVSDPYLIKEWMKGIVKGAVEAECIIPSGEIGDVAELIKGLVDGKGFDMVFATIGVLNKKEIISGKNIKPDDVVLGLKSSGVHSNGISLARKILFKRWGGKYSPYDKLDSLDKELVYEILKPTKIYVKPILTVLKELEVKAAVHITGDAYLKFNRLTQFSKDIGFYFNNFKPQPIFEIIQETASHLGRSISYDEMFKTFNMGWGFAIIIEKAMLNKAINILEKAGIQAEKMGCITKFEGIKIFYKNKRIVL